MQVEKTVYGGSKTYKGLDENTNWKSTDPEQDRFMGTVKSVSMRTVEMLIKALYDTSEGSNTIGIYFANKKDQTDVLARYLKPVDVCSVPAHYKVKRLAIDSSFRYALRFMDTSTAPRYLHLAFKMRKEDPLIAAMVASPNEPATVELLRLEDVVPTPVKKTTATSKALLPLTACGIQYCNLHVILDNVVILSIRGANIRKMLINMHGEFRPPFIDLFRNIVNRDKKLTFVIMADVANLKHFDIN